MQAQPIPIHATHAAFGMTQATSPSRGAMFTGSLEQRLQLSLSLSPRIDPTLRTMLASSLEQRKQSFEGAFLQEEMTRNYTCCGLTLRDLHALVDHFEEAHVVVMDHSVTSAAAVAALSSNVEHTYGGGFQLADDMELDDSPPTQPRTPSLDNASVLVRRASADARAYSPYPLPNLATKLRHSASGDGMCASPTLLFSPSATPSPAPSRSGSPPLFGFDNNTNSAVPSRRASKTGGSSSADLLGDANQVRFKPFRCPKDGCNKSYKQANGLKYHLTHGQCNFAPVDPNSDDCKPYLCQIGCGKRFKNMSGLRYHYQHSGPHGQAGLALLEAGQLPVPTLPSPSESS